MDGKARTGSGCRPMNSSPRDNARPVCLDARLEPRLAIELLSTVQTQPQESADAKRSLGLEADVTGKLLENRWVLYFILTMFSIIKRFGSEPNRPQKHSGLYGHASHGPVRSSRSALPSFRVISTVDDGLCQFPSPAERPYFAIYNLN
jgi:hypothetical protein